MDGRMMVGSMDGWTEGWVDGNSKQVSEIPKRIIQTEGDAYILLSSINASFSTYVARSSIHSHGTKGRGRKGIRSELHVESGCKF